MLNILISSTSIDLQAERAAVKSAIKHLKMHASGMEEFNATTRNALQLCSDEVQKADALVGIYAHCYGFRPTSDMTYTDSNGVIRSGDGKTSITSPRDLKSNLFQYPLRIEHFKTWPESGTITR